MSTNIDWYEKLVDWDGKKLEDLRDQFTDEDVDKIIGRSENHAYNRQWYFDGWQCDYGFEYTDEGKMLATFNCIEDELMTAIEGIYGGSIEERKEMAAKLFPVWMDNIEKYTAEREINRKTKQ